MKLMWFHLMPYTELPDDFNKKHPSVWVDIHSSLAKDVDSMVSVNYSSVHPRFQTIPLTRYQGIY